MPIKVSDYMTQQFKETLEEADVLGAAIWGGVPNIKSQSMLDNRKSTVVHDLSILIRFLSELRENVESLHMVEMNGENAEE